MKKRVEGGKAEEERKYAFVFLFFYFDKNVSTKCPGEVVDRGVALTIPFPAIYF